MISSLNLHKLLHTRRQRTYLKPYYTVRQANFRYEDKHFFFSGCILRRRRSLERSAWDVISFVTEILLIAELISILPKFFSHLAHDAHDLGTRYREHNSFDDTASMHKLTPQQSNMFKSQNYQKTSTKIAHVTLSEGSFSQGITVKYHYSSINPL